MQRVANIFRKLCRLAMKCQVHESRLISISEDEGKSTRAGVSEVNQINRGQPGSIALKPSVRLATECLPNRMQVWRRTCLPSRYAIYSRLEGTVVAPSPVERNRVRRSEEDRGNGDDLSRLNGAGTRLFDCSA
jgi:hypothetical protein